MQAPNIIRKIEMRPVGDKVVIQPVKPEKITKGGIIIPETAKRPPKMGIVVAAGPGHNVENPTPSWVQSAFGQLAKWIGENPEELAGPERFIPNPVKVGDRVLFHKFSGTEILDTDDNQVVIMSSDDILAVLDPEITHCHCTCHELKVNPAYFMPRS